LPDFESHYEYFEDFDAEEEEHLQPYEEE
jgi:hypothetical protein